MTQIIPLNAVPSQNLNVLLSNQPCQINIYQKEPGPVISAAVLFIGSVLGLVLTVTSVPSGAIVIGHALAGPGIKKGTVITNFLSGSGGTGTYIISNFHNAVSSQTYVAPELYVPDALYCDLYVNNVLIIGGVYCRNQKVIVRNVYLGFIGDLAFTDTQGSTDPNYLGLVDRYAFVYYLPTDLASGMQ